MYLSLLLHHMLQSARRGHGYWAGLGRTSGLAGWALGWSCCAGHQVPCVVLPRHSAPAGLSSSAVYLHSAHLAYWRVLFVQALITFSGIKSGSAPARQVPSGVTCCALFSTVITGLFHLVITRDTESLLYLLLLTSSLLSWRWFCT